MKIPVRPSAATAREALYVAKTLDEVARTLVGQLDFDAVVRTAVDEATRVTGAAFGALELANGTTATGSDAARVLLDGLRSTPLLDATLVRAGVVRSEDLARDTRCVAVAPAALKAARSWLAAPVASRSGAILGALVLGHPQTHVFGVQAERLAVGIAVYTAIALDNACVHRDALREVAALRRTIAALETAETPSDRFVARLADELRSPFVAADDAR